jgi:prepilin-type N-terminal cleavage/methylation domain-containing protein
MRPIPTSLRTQNSGFSLIELMVVVAISGILAAVAIQSMELMILKMKFKSQLVMILHTIDLAEHSSEESALLGVVTRNWCQACECSDDCKTANFRSPACEGCRISSDATWRHLGFASTPMSPYNTPYMIDANECEYADRCQFRDQIQLSREDGHINYKLSLPRAVAPDALRLNVDSIVDKLSRRVGDQDLNGHMPP